MWKHFPVVVSLRNARVSFKPRTPALRSPRGPSPVQFSLLDHYGICASPCFPPGSVSWFWWESQTDNERTENKMLGRTVQGYLPLTHTLSLRITCAGQRSEPKQCQYASNSIAPQPGQGCWLQMSLICFTSALPWASGPNWLLGFGKSVFCTLGFVMGEEELAINSRKAGNHSWVPCTTKPTHRGSFTARLCHPHLGFQHTSPLIFQCLQIAAMPDKC